MFLEGPTIGFDGFSMVFEILRAMVNDGLEVNNGLHVPSQKKSAKKQFATKCEFQASLFNLAGAKVRSLKPAGSWCRF